MLRSLVFFSVKCFTTDGMKNTDDGGMFSNLALRKVATVVGWFEVGVIAFNLFQKMGLDFQAWFLSQPAAGF